MAFTVNPITGQLDYFQKKHGKLSGLSADDHLQYLLLAGRAGTTNDPTISIDATGTIRGSGTTGFALNLVSDSGTPEVSLSRSFTGRDRIIMGPGFDPLGAFFPPGLINFLATDTGPVGSLIGSFTASSDGLGTGPTFFGIRSRGTFAAPEGCIDGDLFLNFTGAGFDSDGNFSFSGPGAIKIQQDGASGTDSIPGRIIFETNKIGDNRPIERMTIRHDGKVMINSFAGNALFNVTGDVAFGSTRTECTVDASGNIVTKGSIFGTGGLTIYGSSTDGPFETVFLKASSTGIVGGFTQALTPLWTGMGVTDVKGIFLGQIFTLGPCNLDASSERVQVGALIAGSLFGPITITDDTHDVVYGGYTWQPEFHASNKHIDGGTTYEANPHFTVDGSGSETFNINHCVGLRIEPKWQRDNGGSSTTILMEEITGAYDFPNIQPGATVVSRTGYFFRNSEGGGIQETAIAFYVANQITGEQAWSLLSVGQNPYFAQRGQAQFGAFPIAMSSMAVDINSGDTTITLTNSTGFTASGVVEINDLFYTYTANDTMTGILTLAHPAVSSLTPAGPFTAHQYSLPTSQVDIFSGDTGRVALTVHGMASQTADLTQWKDSSGNVLAFFDAAGILSLGVAGIQTAIAKLNGTTSGTVSVTVLDAAGSWTLTLPDNGGTDKYLLQTDGSGATTWAQVDLTTAAVTGILPVANGGTGSSTQKFPTILFDHYADAGNTGTSETDLYTDTTSAGQLAVNGDKLEAEYGGVFVSSATATRQVKIYFGGTAIFDTGALTLSLSSAWTAYVSIIRKDSSTIRYMISLTTEGAALAAYTATGELGSLTLSNTNVLKITGTAAGVGAANNDIVAKLGSVSYVPAA